MNGILAVDKPAGWTSHDIVARLRRVTGQRQIGHAGTLDPLATGLVLVVLGSATRLSSYLMDSPKTYLAEVVLGATTVTDDAEAPLQEQQDTRGVTEPAVRNCLAGFCGEQQQLPPLYAAVRHQGEKLYVLARRGVEVERQPRTVRIDEIELLGWELPRLLLRVQCGPGTYIRSLARDIGARLGVGAYLHALRRERSGSFGPSDAVELQDLGTAEAVRAALHPPDRAVLSLPAIGLTPDEAARARDGRALPVGVKCSGTVRLYEPTGALLALGRVDGDQIKPFRVFAEERS